MAEEMVLGIEAVLAKWYNHIKGTMVQEAAQAMDALEAIYLWARQNSERYEQFKNSLSFMILLFCTSRKILLGLLGLVWVAISFLLGSVWAAFGFLVGLVWAALSFVVGLVWAAFPFLLVSVLVVYMVSRDVHPRSALFLTRRKEPVVAGTAACLGFLLLFRAANFSLIDQVCLIGMETLVISLLYLMIMERLPVEESETFWESFDSSNYQEIISRSICLVPFSDLKDLYFRLCDSPIFLDEGNLSFSFHKLSGKKCWMLGARLLSITWGDNRKYWKWKSLPESRFSNVAELKYVWWLEIKGRIETKILSPQTIYAAYLVYQLPEISRGGFNGRPVKLSVVNERGEVVALRSVFLDPPMDLPSQARSRGDGWMEIELGEFFNRGDNATMECLLQETDNSTIKRGLIVEGIELRPKNI